MLTRRTLLKSSGLAVGAGLLPREASALPLSDGEPSSLLYLNLNESAFGPSPLALEAVRGEMARLNRYADAASAAELTAQIAAKEAVPAEQIVLGEVLGILGSYFAAKGGPGGEFLYSSPGYLALIDAASHLGGIGVAVPLNPKYQNDLDALSSRVDARTRAVYLVNPHNPTGTVNDDVAFKTFLREVSRRTPIIVDEAYLEYTPDCVSRSAVSAVREGSNVIVFRTFDKIHGLAGLPMGYAIVPKGMGDILREQGAGGLEALGRLNLVAAKAALADVDHVQLVSSKVAAERARWEVVLNDLKLTHSDACASFVFFDAGRPQAEVASALRVRGVVVGRLFPPYTNWVRITIGLPDDNRFAQARLREVLAATPDRSSQEAVGLTSQTAG
jgi:histidinol-phosphate aminotransferase